MPAGDFVRKLGDKARRRAVASIMSYAERSLADRLTEAEWLAFRDKVLNSLAVYHDSMMDIIGTLGDGPSVVNDHALLMLERIHTEQARMARALERARP
ncbi:MAG: hypothetical protein ACXVYY_01450 [Oryzihumus sp.]